MNIVNLLKKGAVFVVGFSVIILGIILLPLPGPGLLIIAFGLLILSSEFAWAERHLATMKSKMKQVLDKAKSNSSKDKQ